MATVPHPTALADLARRCKSGGLGALSRLERRKFRFLFEKELRKRAFKPTSTNARKILNDFCDHVIRGFDEKAKPAVVIDSQPYLRRTAKHLSKHEAPLASLILYAAWIEHWTNIMVTVAMLRQGAARSEPLAFLNTQPRFEEKLDKLADTLSIGRLPKKLRDSITEVVKNRNRHFHFVWEGKSPERVRKDRDTLRAIVKRCDQVLDDARAFEYHHFDAPYAKLVSSVFRLR